MMRRVIYFFQFFCILVLLTNCNAGKDKNNASKEMDAGWRAEVLQKSPVLSPEESLKAMKIEDGFEVKLVAAEPLTTTPVAMSFDDKGRMWVVEMEGYMPDTLGNGEERSDGKIVILEDKNGDGIADTRTVFLDSLVLPRAICLIDNGILVAEPPKLWYVPVVNDKPAGKILVDSVYAAGGNVEHQPNGLIRGLDNWIYSSDSDKRYRKKGDKWLVQPTHFRGQWGIVQDDYGRMYYNNNSQNLIGDYFAPALGSGNKNQHDVAGYDIKIVEDNKVYPARPNTGVNRGYMDKFLDDSMRLVNFTAACGPVIYRGDVFGKEYYNNAFVAEPSANLVKRNIIEEQGYTTAGRQAYQQKEFIASIDERFRPVSLYNAPDGAIYMIDMYRGIIQHKTYLTDYLKNEIKKRSLTKPLNCGRIYKIIPAGKTTRIKALPTEATALVKLLQSPNGWIRDKAQQMLIDKKDTSVLQTLKNNLHSDNIITVIHSLWTIEGLELLNMNELLPLLQHTNWKVRVQALTALPSIADKNMYKQYIPVLQQMINTNDTIAAVYIAFQLSTCIKPFDGKMADKLLMDLSQKFSQNIFVADAVISNLENKENVFYKRLLALQPDSNVVINQRLKKTLEDIKKSEVKKNANVLKAQFPKGVALFQTVCKTCHGEDGNGVTSLAPPLNLSQWVNGDKDKLIAIVLHGLTGPVKVNNKVYQSPEISGEMPGLGSNKEITDEDIAQVLSYVRKNWSNHAGTITAGEVSGVRKKLGVRQKPFTAEELNK